MDLNCSAKSNYPELDEDQVPSFAWSGHSAKQSNQAANNASEGVQEFSVRHGFTSFHQRTTSRSFQQRRSQNLEPSPQAWPELRIANSPLSHSPIQESNCGNGWESQENFNGDDDAFSDADSDYMKIQSNLASFKNSLPRSTTLVEDYSSGEEILVGHDGTRGRGGTQGRGRARGVIRGARKAAEPTGEIRLRLSKASQAFIEEKYEEAMEIVSEVIRINAETHEAWTLLASVFKELGELEKTLTALMCAAHLRPKDVSGWLSCARFALEQTGELRSKLLVSAKLCYQSAIRANPKNDFEARCGKAAVLRELGNTSSAISQYKRLLKQKPHDTAILRLLAEVYVDEDNVEAAKELYRESISFYTTSTDVLGSLFGWSDINIYVELYAYLGQYDAAIKEIKTLSRWALGRQQESWWDQVVDDDREWDADDSRRVAISHYVPGQYDGFLYGKSLPLELRVKLGLYRLRLGDFKEAMAHFLWLDPDNLSCDDRIIDYPDLFRETADSLHRDGYDKEALTFYKALTCVPEHRDTSLYIQIGQCYLTVKLHEQAEECFQIAIQLDDNNIEARIHLAKMYEDLNEQEQAFIYLSEIMKIRRQQASSQTERSTEDNVNSISYHPKWANTASRSQYRPRRLVDAAERKRLDDLRTEHLQEQYSIMCVEHNSMRAGKQGATVAWMEAAKDLIEDFRSFKPFYPWDKYVHFLGYSGATGEQVETGATPLEADLAAMAHRLSNKLGAATADKGSIAVIIPENYRGISFTAWLDVFLEYALCLARFGRHHESYEICEAAKDAIVYYHSREDMFLIHICWCTCALLANDEEICVSTCRFFMRDYQFTTDAYRMFAAITRLCQSPISWYSSGPTQKYILRQIKAMDYALVEKDFRTQFFAEKGSYSAQDEEGRPVVNKDMDLALLMLYGHILFSGTSYPYALNYFMRAYALDPENPMINLSIGLGYVHYGLKRQSENRQFHIMQGFSFLFRYYDYRKGSTRLEERQEAHYNMARTYHMLGLAHLALPYYTKVLQEGHSSTQSREDLVCDAAYNLQTLYAMGDNLEMAKIITDSWLTV